MSKLIAEMEAAQELVDYMQAKEYKRDAYFRVVAFMLKNKDEDADSENFEKYHSKYERSLAECEIAKAELGDRVTAYVKEKFPKESGGKLNWFLDYKNKIVRIFNQCKE